MDSYVAPSGEYDEYLDTNGKPRPHWDAAASQLSKIDEGSWQQRHQQLDELIKENGITYNVYQDNQAEHQRQWSLDLLPLMLDAKEIEDLEERLSQRVHLLNLVLEDVYGRQTLLRSGGMHPYILYGNPSFHPPCHGLVSHRHKHIQIYSADLTRGPDGSWIVLGDRVEPASGLGYALANRMLATRTLPKLMQAMEVASLQPFVNAFSRAVESLSPFRSDNPNVALLTPGPTDETYFEHNFLARNLGYTLAEGADLTVRNNQLYMKTIGGVQRVDVLLRRVNSQFCDPLELRSDSLIGVPGLTNAVRQGNLSVSNSLGSGFVQTSSLLAFLPWFSRNFLGESLEIPSVATWWCGQESEKKFVIDNIDRLAIKPTFWASGINSQFGPNLTTAEKQDLIARINHRPEAYCGQEIVSASTIPVADGYKLVSRHSKLRVFLVATEDGWKMMPGGLARYSKSVTDLSITTAGGGTSKDVWVVGKSKHKGVQEKRPVAHVSVSSLQKSQSELPSRSADNLFWLGRYIERAESRTRVLHSLWTILAEESAPENQKVAIPFLEQIVPSNQNISGFLSHKGTTLNTAKTEEAILEALFNENNSDSLISTIASVERTASKAKERLSTDTWKRLVAMRDITQATKNQDHSVYDNATIELLEHSLEALSAFIGNLMENTTRTQGWRFLEIGRRIERAGVIANMLQSSFIGREKDDEILIPKLLAWADSAMTYRRRYLNTYTDINTLDVICLDYDNPRALAFQAQQLKNLLAELPHAINGERNPIDQTALRVFSSVALADISAFTIDSRGEGGKLDTFFQEIITNLGLLGSHIESTYFAHTQPQVRQSAQINLG